MPNIYPAGSNIQLQYDDQGVASVNPGFLYQGQENNALAYEQREINGVFYTAQNATWSKFAQTWSLVNPALPAHATALYADGSFHYLSSPVDTTPFAWVDQGTLPIPANVDLSAIGIFNVKYYGAKGDDTTDDTLAVRAAVNAQQLVGGTVYFPPGTYLFALDLNGFVPAPSNGTIDATHPLLLKGAGMYSSILKCGFSYSQTLMLYYQPGSGIIPKVAQVIASDLCFDGNYVGAGGAFNQQVTANALIQLPAPFNAIPSQPGTVNLVSNGFHLFERCRFFRPTGFGILATSSNMRFHLCVFDACGQPNLSPQPAATHWDNIGSQGQCVVGVSDCYWQNSGGNYTDIQCELANTGSTLLFSGNMSYNHQRGGIYGAGVGSIISGNYLSNNVAGEGIGYDTGTLTSLRSANLVSDNVLVNMTVYAFGLSGAYGDRVSNNIASDAPQGNLVSQPAVPASGIALMNPYPGDCDVYVAGGTVISIAIAGASGVYTNTSTTSGLVRLPVLGKIKITYSVLPTWNWFSQ